MSIGDGDRVGSGGTVVTLVVALEECANISSVGFISFIGGTRRTVYSYLPAAAST